MVPAMWYGGHLDHMSKWFENMSNAQQVVVANVILVCVINK